MSRVKIFVATHKRYQFPEEEIYVPIQVGSSLSKDNFGYVRDDEYVDNISDKNKNYSELTALYEIWKNPKYLNEEYIGLVHYRRYFSGKTVRFKGTDILGENEVIKLLSQYDVIVPQKRNYVVETIYEHYKNAHFEKDILILKDVLSEKYPDYIDSFNKLMKSRRLHLYNMFVMKRQDFESYIKWLFDVLFEVEKRVDISGYSPYQARIYGFMSERLWNVWLMKNELKRKEVKVVNIEGESMFDKAVGLLKRKFFGKKL